MDDIINSDEKVDTNDPKEDTKEDVKEDPKEDPKEGTATTAYQDRVEQGRRVFVKGEDTAQFTSRKISMAALPDAKHGLPVRVMAKRAVAVNVAVKAFAIASKRLAESDLANAKVDIIAIPSFRENRNELCILVDDLARLKAKAVPTTEKSDFVISTSTDPKMTAGAIASAAREGTASSVQGIGPDSVFNCIRAVAIAREYLDDKDDKVDLFITAQFVEVKFEKEEGRKDRTGTALKLNIFLHEGRIE
jgi:stage V sporulation protein SpoVS